MAAFLVFLHHFGLAFYPAYYFWDIKMVHIRGNFEIHYGQSLFSFLSNGNFCVCIFFVLSGFVLSRRYFNEHSQGILISGAQKRFLRLYIPVAFTLIVSFLLLAAGLYYNLPARVITHSEAWWGPNLNFPDCTVQFLNALLYVTMLVGDNAFDTSMWTMSIELYGSLFVFALLALTHNTRNRIVSLLVVLLYCFLMDSIFLSGFVLGISLNYVAQAKRRWQEQPGKDLSSFCSPVLLVTALILGSYPSTVIIKDTFFAHIGHSILACWKWFHMLGGFMLVLSFVLSSRLQRFMSRKLFSFLGYISFSFYLLHPLVISSLGAYTFLGMYKRIGYNHAALIEFLLCTIVSVIAAWAMTKCIDVPGTKFAKFIYDRFFQERRQPENIPLSK